MITVEEAKNKVEINCNILPASILKLNLCVGKVLAVDIVSPLNSPPFAQSAMDGYAVNLGSVRAETPIEVMGIAQAGDTAVLSLETGKAIRIFTGAAIPAGTDTVVMLEHVELEGNFIRIKNHAFTLGTHIRKMGSQIKKGEIALRAGKRLNPGLIGYLAGLGIKEVPIVPAPKLGLILTGKELVMPGEELQHGQIYESNSWMLEALMQSASLSFLFKKTVDDFEEDVIAAIEEGLSCCDVLLVSGGISVGDFDFVERAFHKNGVEALFYKVKQKPGKPLFFGKKGETLVFGLPGNPASVLSCCYEYVVPAIRKMMGLNYLPYGIEKYPIGHDYTKKAGLTHFLKARIEQGFVYLCDGQESYKLNAFSEANCLAVLPQESTIVSEGTPIEIHLFDDCWR
ncbi:MAG: molybdopterin molybdotransferase MoeA [Bacteroidia bacterium]|nr:molybdopterin molybdotransferase MoeA [Bacteroidia bacterium]